MAVPRPNRYRGLAGPDVDFREVRVCSERTVANSENGRTRGTCRRVKDSCCGSPSTRTLGHDGGQALFDDEVLARVALQMADLLFPQQSGRCRAREFTPGLSLRLRDEKPTCMTAEESVRGLGDGRYL